MSQQKIFITGGTGFIGRAVTELAVKEGYSVRALSRRDAGDSLLKSLGATPVRGDLNSHELLTEESKNADIVLHFAFDHDFSKPYKNLVTLEIGAVTALAQGLEGTGKPLLVTNGTAFVQPDPNGGETDETAPIAETSFGQRDVAETHALSFAEKGVRVISIRLPQYVYGHGSPVGFTGRLLEIAAKSGESVYIGDGEYCFSEVHVDDVAKLYLIAAKEAKPGEVFNCTGNTTTTYKAFATAIGELLQMPVKAITQEEAAARWGLFLTGFVSIRNRASNKKAVEQLGWKPEGPSLLSELRSGSYAAAAQKLKKDASSVM